MTQVSQFGLDNPNDIQLENLSDLSEDENREDEIKKVLEALSNETFDYDSEDSSHVGSRSSSVNHNGSNATSFLSNKEESQIFVNGKVNGLNNNGGLLNGVNLNMLPNAIGESPGIGNYAYPMNINTKTGNMNTAINGQLKVNGSILNGNSASAVPNPTKPKKQVTIVEMVQKNRDAEEMEESNPTISLLHKDHCPRNNENGGHVDGEMWLAAENKEEQMKTLLNIRERQIHRGEEEIVKLQKDKRSLNHQIGLMKTEMVQIKSQQEDAEKFAHLKEQECEYLKTKLREAIEEYEKAKRGQIAAHDEVSQMNSEIDKLKQEVQLLSSIGSSTQQAEVSDVVRQLREKHAADFVAWKKVVTELEGQLRTYKRQQQLLMEESFVGTKINAGCQTEESTHSQVNTHQVSDIKSKEKTQIAIMEDAGPICVDAFTSPAETDEIQRDDQLSKGLELQDAAVQVNLSCVVTSKDGETQLDRLVNSNSSQRDVSSIVTQTDVKAISNAVIQTDETLETYKILAQLLESWSTEVQIAKANEEEMTLKCRESEEELHKFRKQFKLLQKVATKCRKESKRREEAFKKQIAEMKTRYMEVLQQLNEKLEIVA
ncbi:hypothetical protein Ocin01_07442 [Orchesella cincta]|uniref:Uncharacterized protein n=1 Tax=Orchesella cincta TaxID=48709 RepID=A0A1D2N1Q9_ORCCI|nr:hypothetical protein Ocin01_07442 [Orchesella cincta]